MPCQILKGWPIILNHSLHKWTRSMPLAGCWKCIHPPFFSLEKEWIMPDIINTTVMSSSKRPFSIHIPMLFVKMG